MVRRRFRAASVAVVFLALIAVGLGLTSSGPTVTMARAAPAAPAVQALKPDPLILFGKLPNGLRYAIRRNAQPEGTMSIRLRIDAGSLHERDNERGVAHFLEHMAFNGSQNYPEGEMFRALQRMGMQVGSAANASTSYDSTTFTLSLPSVRPTVVKTGFNILREIVSRLSFDPEAIRRERGVILSEERARDTPQSRAGLDSQALVFKGQLYPQRAPIGDVAFIKSASPEALRSFYTRYYRPDRALLVVAGDSPPAVLEKQIQEAFGDWAAPGPMPPKVDFGTPAKRGLEAACKSEPQLEESLALQWVRPAETRADTPQLRREQHLQTVAIITLNRRLGRLSRSGDAPFIDASLGVENVLGAGRLTYIGVQPHAGMWRRSLAAVEQEVRRALTHGFQQSEVEREALEQTSPFKFAAANVDGRSNMDVAEQITTALEMNQVPTDPATNLAVYSNSIRGIRAAEVTQALRQLVGGSGPLIFLTQGQGAACSARDIEVAYRESLKVAVAPPAKDGIKAFTYRDFGPKGRVAERWLDNDLASTFVRFENGVMLNVKSTSFEKDRVIALVRMAGGNLVLPKAKPGLAWALPFAFVEGGVGRLEIQELEQTEPGHFAGIDLGLEDGRFQFFGETVRRDVLLQMQVFGAFITDPGYRPDGLRRLQAAADGQLREQTSKPSGVLARMLPGVMRGNDPRWAAATIEQIRALTMDDVKAAIGPSLERAPLEVTIVGNVDVEEAIDAVAKTLGALPPRDRNFVFPDGATRVSFPQGKGRVTLAHRGRDDQAVVASAWPAPALFGDVREELIMRVMSEVLQLRLLDEVREAQGATYTPFGQYFGSSSIPGFGYIFAGVEPNPAAVEPFFATLKEITDELRAGKLSDDLLDRARKPILYQLYAAETTNEYWLSALSDLQLDPRHVRRVKMELGVLESIRANEVIDFARKYLRDDSRLDIRVLPQARMPQPEGRASR